MPPSDASTTSTTAILRAPAKLTTELRVIGVRADGYHLIDAEMVSLSLADTVQVTAPASGSDEHRLTVTGPFAEGVPTDQSNLVVKALRLAGRSGDVHLDKQVPHGGGLGGGSSDAAAVLRWAGFGDLVAASRLGADIPFCLVGGRARVSGIGEVVEQLPPQTVTYTIVIPPFGMSTPAVYRAWDDLGGPRGSNGNDLEPAAIAIEPRLVSWKRMIAECAGATPRMAGSGSTWFLEGAHEALSELLPGAIVLVVTT